MSLHILNTSQRLPVTIEEAWNFLSSPANLKVITPEYMDFKITSGYDGTISENAASGKMFSGMIISYVVKPMLNIPVKWVTEITHVREPYYFVDEQRFGPYKFWHHKHFLKEVPGGVEITDIVHYKLPFGILGELTNQVFVRKKLGQIFEYRFNKLEKLFGKI